MTENAEAAVARLQAGTEEVLELMHSLVGWGFSAVRTKEAVIADNEEDALLKAEMEEGIRVHNSWIAAVSKIAEKLMWVALVDGPLDV